MIINLNDRSTIAIIGLRNSCLFRPLQEIVRTWLAMFGAAALATASPAAAGTYSILYQFGPYASGSYGPQSIVALPSGSLVGLAQELSGGVIYKLDPPRAGQTKWSYSIIYAAKSFPIAGQFFGSSLLVDAAGNIYGSTRISNYTLGSGRSGTIYRLSPPASGSGAWNCDVVFQGYSLNGTNMSPTLLTYLDPTARRLYGLGFYYQPIGAAGKPVGLQVFRLDLSDPYAAPVTGKLATIGPPVGTHDSTAVTLIYSREGAFYGTSFNRYRQTPTRVFRLTQPAAGTNARQLQTLATSLPNATYPNTSAVIDSDDRITGVGLGPLSTDYGNIWRLSPPAEVGGAWQSTLLYTFKGPSDQDGSRPQQILNHNGVFYGITVDGGKAHAGVLASSGTLFELTSPPSGSTATEWSEHTLHTFGGPVDGALPQMLTAVTGPDGSYALYGVTLGGGYKGSDTIFYGDGTIFRYVP